MEALTKQATHPHGLAGSCGRKLREQVFRNPLLARRFPRAFPEFVSKTIWFGKGGQKLSGHQQMHSLDYGRPTPSSQVRKLMTVPGNKICRAGISGRALRPRVPRRQNRESPSVARGEAQAMNSRVAFEGCFPGQARLISVAWNNDMEPSSRSNRSRSASPRR
jgi:hypothetical protein